MKTKPGNRADTMKLTCSLKIEQAKSSKIKQIKQNQAPKEGLFLWAYIGTHIHTYFSYLFIVPLYPNNEKQKSMDTKIIMDRLATIERCSLLAAKNVLTIDDVVLLTGLSKQHIYKLTWKKQIPYYKPNGKLMYFDRLEVENWMRQNRHDTQEEAEQKAAVYVLEHSK